MDEQTPTPPQSTPVDTKPESPILQTPVMLEQPAKSKKKIWLWVGFGIASLLLASVAFWVMTKQPETAKTTQQTQQAPQAVIPTTKPGPLTIVYSQAEDTGITPPDCGELAKATIFWRPAEGGERKPALTLDNGLYVGFSAAKSQALIFDTTAACGATAKGAIYMSSDAGKTFSKVTEGFAKDRTTTSLVISADGKNAGVATVGTDVVSGNIIYNLELSSKKVTELFTSTSAGVFVQYFDVRTGKVYFNEGCYFCDGNSVNTLRLYDITSKKTETVFKKPDGIGMYSETSSDASKVLYLSGVQGDGLGGGPPYTLSEFSLETKKFQILKELDDVAVRGIGYRIDDQAAYYIADKAVYGASGSVIFEAQKKIQQVHYLDKNVIIFSAGEYDNLAVQRYEFATKKSTLIFNGDKNTRILGVTTQ